MRNHDRYNVCNIYTISKHYFPLLDRTYFEDLKFSSEFSSEISIIRFSPLHSAPTWSINMHVMQADLFLLKLGYHLDSIPLEYHHFQDGLEWFFFSATFVYFHGGTQSQVFACSLLSIGAARIVYFSC